MNTVTSGPENRRRVTTALGTFTVQGEWDEASQGCPVFRANASDYNVSFATPSASKDRPGWPVTGPGS